MLISSSTATLPRADVPSAESSRTVRGLGKGTSGKPYPCLCNARRPRLEPGIFRSQAVHHAAAAHIEVANSAADAGEQQSGRTQASTSQDEDDGSATATNSPQHRDDRYSRQPQNLAGNTPIMACLVWTSKTLVI